MESNRTFSLSIILHILELGIILIGGAIGYGRFIEKVDDIDRRHTAQMENTNQRLGRIENYIDKSIIFVPGK